MSVQDSCSTTAETGSCSRLRSRTRHCQGRGDNMGEARCRPVVSWSDRWMEDTCAPRRRAPVASPALRSARRGRNPRTAARGPSAPPTLAPRPPAVLRDPHRELASARNATTYRGPQRIWSRSAMAGRPRRLACWSRPSGRSRCRGPSHHCRPSNRPDRSTWSDTRCPLPRSSRWPGCAGTMAS